MSRSEKSANSVKQSSRELMWLITEDISRISMTPDLAMSHTQLISAQLQTLKFLAKLANQDWIDFNKAYLKLRQLVNLSDRPYGQHWQNFCLRVCFGADKKQNYGRALTEFIPDLNPSDYLKLGKRRGYVSETKSLLGKSQLVVTEG